MFKKKKFYKPFYKQFTKRRKNIQNRTKIFKFKKQKWKTFQFHAKRQLKFFKRYRMRDQYKISISKFASRGNSFQKQFRNNLHDKKNFFLFYGDLKKRYFKNILKKIKNNTSKKLIFQNCYKYQILKLFESRLDTVIYRSCFRFSIKSSRQLIFHGHVLVNKIPIRTPSYILKDGDLIEIAGNNKSRTLVLQGIERSNFWPIPPKHLIINYNTLQILFLYDKNLNMSPIFSHYLNVDSLITNMKK